MTDRAAGRRARSADPADPADPGSWEPLAVPEPARTRGAVVVGMDGCRGRWMTVRADPDRTLSARLVDDPAPLVTEARAGAVAVIAIDMPIGLLTDRPRPADRAARVLLGPRRSTVFPAPVRAVLDAADYADACERSRRASGRALSRQSFNLVPAIARLDQVLGPDDERVVEAHPELALARLNGGHPLDPKRTAVGRRRRLDLLTGALGPGLAPLVADPGLPTEDLLDAAALVVTALHVVGGSEHRLGGGVVDPTGKRVQVVY